MNVTYCFEIGDFIDSYKSTIKNNEIRSSLSVKDLISLLKNDCSEDFSEPNMIRLFNNEIKCFEIVEEDDVIDFRKFAITNQVDVIIKLVSDQRNSCLPNEENLKIVENNLRKIENTIYKRSHIIGNDKIEIFKQISSEDYEKSNINIAFLYFKSLSFDEKNKETKNKSINYVIDFEPEINKLKKLFIKLNYKLGISFQTANNTNFSEILKQSSEILFISCIGIFTPLNDDKKFSLCLEDDKGDLNVISLETLQILTNNNQVKLLIINSNYKNAMYDYFFDCKNFPNIICIQSRYHVLDKAGMEFLKHLFKNLLNKNSISDSFNYAIDIIKKESKFNVYNSCCCAHFKNIEDDRLKHFDLYNKEHDINNNYFFCQIHNEAYMSCYKIYNNMTRKIFNFMEKFSFHQRQPHNDDLFKNLHEGKPIFKCSKFFLNNNLCLNLEKNIFIGFNEQLKFIINQLLNIKEKKIFNIYDECRSGKKTIAKLAAKYTMEKFKSVVFIQSNIPYSYHFLKFCFKKQLNIAVLNKDEIYDIISEMELLIIIVINENNVNDIINNFIYKFGQKTKNSILLLISNEKLKLDIKFIDIQMDYLSGSAAKTLLNILAIKLNSNIEKNVFYKLRNLLLNMTKKLADKDNLKLNFDKKIFKTLIDENEKIELMYLLTLCPNGLFLENVERILKKNYKGIINELSKMHYIIRISYDKIYDKKIITLSDYSKTTLDIIIITTLENSRNKVKSLLFSFYRKFFRSIVILKKELIMDNEFIDFNYGFWLSLNCVEEEINNVSFKSFNKSSKPDNLEHLNKQSSKTLDDYGSSYDNTKNEEKMTIVNRNFIPMKSKPINAYRIKNRYFRPDDVIEVSNEDEIHFELNNISKILNLDFINNNFNENSINSIKDDLEDLSITVLIVLKHLNETEEFSNLISKLISITNSSKYELTFCRGRLLLYLAQNVDIVDKYNLNLCLINNDKIIRNSNHEITNEMMITELIEDKVMCIEKILDYLYDNIFDSFNEARSEVQLFRSLKMLENFDAINISTNNYMENLKLLKSNIEDCDENSTLAKFTFLLAEYDFLHNNFTEDILKNYLKAKDLFHTEKMFALSFMCLSRIIHWFIGVNNLFQARAFLLEMKEYRNSYLVTFRNNGLRNKINIEFFNLETKIIEKFKKNTFNKIIFLKAYQLVKKNLDKIIPVEPMVQYVNNFKANMIHNFKEVNKNLAMQFDILTEQNLEEAFKLGCRILYISTEVFDNSDSLFVEDKFGFSHEIYSNKIINFVKKYGALFTLIILAFPQSEKIAELFIKNGIKHVIYFQFQNEFLKANTEYPIFSISNLFMKFTKKLLTNLITKEKTLKESFEKAKKQFNQTIKIITDDFEKYKIKIDLENYASSELKSSESSEIGIYFEEGSFKHVSKLRTQNKHSINKRDFQFVGRKIQLIEGLEIIMKNNDLLIQSKPGLGKTCFSKELAYYFNMRNHFMSGIYYLDIHDITSNVIDFMRKEIPSIFEIKYTENSSIINSTLIILDNCDQLFGNDIENMREFSKNFNKSKEKNIYFIFTFSNKMSNINNCKIVKLKKITPNESIMLFLLNIKRRLNCDEITYEITSENDNIINLLGKNKNLKAIIGFPKKIIKLAHQTYNKNLKDIILPRKKFRNTLSLSWDEGKKKKSNYNRINGYQVIEFFNNIEEIQRKKSGRNTRSSFDESIVSQWKKISSIYCVKN